MGERMSKPKRIKRADLEYVRELGRQIFRDEKRKFPRAGNTLSVKYGHKVRIAARNPEAFARYAIDNPLGCDTKAGKYEDDSAADQPKESGE